MNPIIDFKKEVRRLERRLIETAMRNCLGTRDRAAAYLGLAKMTLDERLRRFGWNQRGNWQNEIWMEEK